MAQIPGNPRVNQYTAVADQTEFIYSFKIYAVDEIEVQQGDTILTLTTHYTVQDAGESSGGTINLVTGATTGDIITLTGNSMIERGTTFTNGGDYLATAINGEYDRLDNITKELVTAESTFMKLAKYSPSISAIIPDPDARKALVWNTAEDALELTTYDPDTAQTDSAASAAAALVSETNAAASETNAAASETAAATSETNAAASAVEADGYAQSINNAALGTDIIPDVTNTRSLGNTSYRWNNIYAKNIHGGNVIQTVNSYCQMKGTGDLKAANGNFAVAATTGNTTIAGTLTVGGEIVKPVTYMIVTNTQGVTTAGGTFTSGADRTRVLNTVETNTITGASLNSDQITLPAGTYSIRASAPAFAVDIHTAFIYNITTSSTVGHLGTTEYTNDIYTVTRSLVDLIVTFATPTVIEVRHRCGITRINDGFGKPVNIAGFNSIYTIIKIAKI